MESPDRRCDDCTRRGTHYTSTSFEGPRWVCERCDAEGAIARTPRQQSATEQALLAEFPEEADRIALIFTECDRAAQAIDQARAEDIRRAAEGRRVLG